jgi:CRP-like cAMP-binding protein
LDAEKAYVILSGSVDVSIGGQSVATLSAGEIFGEYALVSREPRTATVTTRETVACLTITEDLLLHLVSEYAQVNDTLLGRIKDNIRNARGIFRGC